MEEELQQRGYRVETARPTRPEDVQRALPQDVVLLDFLEYSDVKPAKSAGLARKPQRLLAAFIVAPDRPIEVVSLGPVEPIAEAIGASRSLVSGNGNSITEDAATSATVDKQLRLRELVWSPLEPFLGKTRTVLISPDGVTAIVPWSALRGKEPGTYLIESRAIAILPVPQLLPELLAQTDEATRSEPTLLLVGDPDFNATTGLDSEENPGHTDAVRGREPMMKWRELPGTREELLAVKDVFERRYPQGKVTVLRGAAATKTTVEQLAPQYHYLHIATSGFFASQPIPSGANALTDFDPQLLSGLVLAGANNLTQANGDDGILTALEVNELDLSELDLVTLSACETARGETIRGEGVFGLQRAFQVAGAHCVIATIPQIPDRETAVLMGQFYENLWTRKMSKVEALRQAQLYVLQNVSRAESDRAKGPAERLSPSKWGGFIVSGDWR